MMRKRLDPVDLLLEAVGGGDLHICGMVRLEVLRGLRIPNVRSKMEAAFDLMLNVPTDNRLWEEATEIAWNLDRRGSAIPSTDILVATCAIRAEAALFTFDRHFQAVPGLRVIGSLDEL